MNTVFTAIQLISAILLIIVVLMQNQGSGVGELFGGSGNVFRKKRGIEKLLFTSTIVISIIFFGTSLIKTII